MMHSKQGATRNRQTASVCLRVMGRGDARRVRMERLRLTDKLGAGGSELMRPGNQPRAATCTNDLAPQRGGNT
ncbi:MAG TPA: hypothetical protein PKJ41_09240 [Bryobacteraceae bacterium]|nr:hypothetical protein [Bryobacteraceae bacterium]